MATISPEVGVHGSTDETSSPRVKTICPEL
jgi:hypothetical protein